MTLNVSVLLKADSADLKRGLGEGTAALKSFAGGAQAASTASAKIGEATGSISGIFARVGSSIKGASGNVQQGLRSILLQANDVAVGLGSGQSFRTVLLQQGTQIAQAFGPAGWAVAAIGGGLLVAAQSFKLFEEDAGAAVEEAASRIDGAIKEISASIAAGLPEVDKLVKGFAEVPQSLRGLEIERQATTRLDLVADAEKAGEELQNALRQFERAAGARLGVGGEGRADLGGLAGELTRQQAEAVASAVAAARAGTATDLETIRSLNAVAAEAKGGVDELAKAIQNAFETTARAEVAVANFDQARQAIVATGQAAEHELGGRLVTAIEGVDAAVEGNLSVWARWYQDLVGGSVIPEMVTESSSWFDKLKADLTGKTKDATGDVANAFNGLSRQVSSELASMIAHNKLALSDFAGFAQSTAQTVLQGIIQTGLNAGFNYAFAPSTTVAPATGPGGLAVGGGATSRIFHAGGVVGGVGAPTRRVPAALFAHAVRMHEGGPVLRANEVPAILEAGETVTPKGARAGGNMTVVINDQRSGGAPIQARERRGPGGSRLIEVTIRDQVKQAIGSGELDTVLRARYGFSPATGAR